jgi:hypothetical protein
MGPVYLHQAQFTLPNNIYAKVIPVLSKQLRFAREVKRDIRRICPLA